MPNDGETTMSMEILLPGRKRVDATYNGFRICTDQPADAGGASSAPSPFDLFLASLGTCAGYYVLSFCQQRNLSTEGVSLTLSADWEEAKHRLARIRIEILLPRDFPDEYFDACVRAARQCTVKRHLDPALNVEVAARFA